MKKKFWYILLALLVLIQFIPYHIKNADRNPKADLFSTVKGSKIIESMVRKACYDCHSQEARTPWYGKVAPLKFWLNKHVRGGRMHLDFSVWRDMTVEDRNHAIKEITQELESHEMPLNSYLWMHKDARLTDADRNRLIMFFNSIKE